MSRFRAWLMNALGRDEPVALFEPVLAGLLRMGTHPKIYKTPTPRKVIEGFIEDMLSSLIALQLRAAERHCALFLELCRRADCKGNLIQDAYLAALALEHNCRWITTDRDYARFSGLAWRHPLDDGKDTRNPA